MLLNEYMLGVVASLSANPIYNSITNHMSEKTLRDRVLSYIEIEKSRNGLYSIDEEYDYEGLYDYFKSNLIGDVVGYLRSATERKDLKDIIIRKAENYAYANTPQSRNQVVRIVEITISIIRNSIYGEVPTSTLVPLNDAEERLTEHFSKGILKAKSDILTAIESRKSEVFREFDLIGFIDARKEIALNQPLFPWFRDSIRFRDAFKDNLFIVPRFKSDITFDKLPSLRDTYMAFLGSAGAGKSTLLMYIFAFSVIQDTNVIYLTAKDTLKEPGLLQKINASPLYNGNKHLLLIDSVDEAFFNNYKGYEQFIQSLKMLSNCRVWLGCRTDFYTTYYGDNTALAQKTVDLLPWDEGQYKQFIIGYSNICGDDNLPLKIDRILGNHREHIEMKQNPFQLALVVYLVAEPDPDTKPVSGVYDLYERFLKLWIRREKQRGSSESSIDDIMESLRNAADSIYTKSEWKLDATALANTAISCLLIQSDSDSSGNPIATAFYHRSLAAFILAQSITDCFRDCNYETAQILLSTKLKDDVTNFVGDKIRCMKESDREFIKSNLEIMYDQCEEDEAHLSFHEQIIYFITRMDVNVDDFLLKIVDRNPNNLIMRLTLAYGCVLSENERIRQYALDYAISISQNSDDAKTNRGWTVVYFGDVNDKDPYTYLDNEKRPWAKAREARIRRFTKDKPRKKDVRFWLFDIPLFRSFLEDRGWNDISKSEYDNISSLSITKQFFNDQEIAFLKEEKALLMKEYAEHINCLRE